MTESPHGLELHVCGDRFHRCPSILPSPSIQLLALHVSSSHSIALTRFCSNCRGAGGDCEHSRCKSSEDLHVRFPINRGSNVLWSGRVAGIVGDPSVGRRQRLRTRVVDGISLDADISVRCA